MRLRADQLMVAGVALLGGYAIYRMLLSGPTAAFDSPAPGGVLPALPGAPGVPPAGSTVVPVTPALPLRQGGYYAGRLESVLSSGAPSGLGSDIAGALASLGFSDVQVWSSPAEASGHVPDYALANPGAGTRWFKARWGKASGSIPRPAALVMVWATLPPK